MAKIKVEGLGIIEIEGDVPTSEEIKAMKKLFLKLQLKNLKKIL